MKKLLAFTLLLCLFDSCNKEEPSWEQYYNGFALAKKNGVDWSAHPRAIYFDYDGAKIIALGFDVFNEYDMQREAFIFNFLPRTAGFSFVYPTPYDSVGPTSGYYLRCDDGDVLCGAYRVIPGPDSYINITVYDSLTGDLKGTFAGVYVEDTSYSGNPVPDTIRFTYGYFSTVIQK